MMLKGAGLDVIDLGVDCDIDKFSNAVSEGCSAVLCSALLTTTMPYMKTIADHFKDDANVKVIIGGAPVTQAYADEIGADGYGTDANDAVRIVEQCLKLAS
jgi:5-methyltetrahydrofolate--homocysteine methyltransferase